MGCLFINFPSILLALSVTFVPLLPSSCLPSLLACLLPSLQFRPSFPSPPSFLSSCLPTCLPLLPPCPPCLRAPFHDFITPLFPSYLSFLTLSLLLFPRKSLIHFFACLFNRYKTSLNPISLVNRWTASKNSQTLSIP